MTRLVPAVWIGIGLVTLSGCVGYNRVLFVTKTNVGFEASTTPPVFQLAIARTEGVVAPQFENGKKLPVLASFKFANVGFFAPAVGSAFATGDAATTLAALYDNATPGGNWETRAKWVCDPSLPGCEGLPTDSTLTLSHQPTITPPFPANLLPTPTFQETDVRPVFFGTDTSLGIKIAWSTMSSTFPDSARFGYHRKELAFVPIAKETTSQTVHKLRMSSLMATIDSGTGAQVAEKTPGLNYEHMQYFATGNAATLLALQRDVRLAMIARLDPNRDLQKQQFAANLAPSGRDLAFILLDPIYEKLIEMAPTSPSAKTIVQRLDSLAPANLDYDFPIYEYILSRGELLTRKDTLSETRPFKRLHLYRTQLNNSIKILEAALVDEKLAMIGGTLITDKTEGRKTVYRALVDLKEKQTAFEQKLSEASEVFAQAVNFFFH